jgi:hypothetical protein
MWLVNLLAMKQQSYRVHITYFLIHIEWTLWGPHIRATQCLYANCRRIKNVKTCLGHERAT